MTEFLAKPGFLGTYGSMGADLSLLLAIFFTTLFLVAWYMAKKHHGGWHHFIALWAMLAMLVYFTFYYLVKGLGVLAIEGKEGFGGPDWVYAYIFAPVLTIHILMVSIGLVMAVYMIILGFRASHKNSVKISSHGDSFHREGTRVLNSGVLKASNRHFYIALSSVLAVLALLAVIRCETLRCATVYAAGMGLIACVFFLEKGVEKWLPMGAQRHRFLGRFTVALFVTVLLTSCLTYLFLYVLYTPLPV